MSLPEGWVKFAERWESVGARKWFGDHYKEVVVDSKTGDLAGAAAAVDQEAELRAKATVDAANAHADELEARAAAIRDAGTVAVPPEPAVVEEPAPSEVTAEPVVVPTIEELRAEADKLASEIAELEAKDSEAPEATETPDEVSSGTPAETSA